ncbi:hypothetical protein FBULB1_1961 [Fusarium bulbicola]|nr:hypothetical protein FBULB1_1961 [Fusarium bulbicola]
MRAHSIVALAMGNLAVAQFNTSISVSVMATAKATASAVGGGTGFGWASANAWASAGGIATDIEEATAV